MIVVIIILNIMINILQSCMPAPSQRAMAAAASEEYSCEFGSNK